MKTSVLLLPPWLHPNLGAVLLTIIRLEPVIIELERQRAPVVVISHQVILLLLMKLSCAEALNVTVCHVYRPYCEHSTRILPTGL